MEIPLLQWYDAIFIRRSRRQFDTRPIEPNLLGALRTVCKEFRPFPQARAVLVTQSTDEVFKGVLGHYGKIKGAPAFIAFIGDSDSPYIHEQIGYLGEGIILEATAMTLGTCWVGGFFRPEAAASLAGTQINERVFAVTPIGYVRQEWSFEEKIMSGFGSKHQRKPLSELVTGLEEVKWPVWMKKCLEAARLAPSAVNRQPWRFYLESDSITISVDNLNDTFNISKRLDCGIAMLHIEITSLNFGVKGKWEFLEAPKVARYHIVCTR